MEHNMGSRLQIAMDDVPRPARFDARIREKVVKLEEVCPRLAACRVVVKAPFHQREPRRKLFTVQLNITFPGGEVVVTRNHHEDLFVVLRDAFVAGRRALDRCTWRNGGVAGYPAAECKCNAGTARPGHA